MSGVYLIVAIPFCIAVLIWDHQRKLKIREKVLELMRQKGFEQTDSISERNREILFDDNKRILAIKVAEKFVLFDYTEILSWNYNCSAPGPIVSEYTFRLTTSNTKFPMYTFRLRGGRNLAELWMATVAAHINS